MLLAESISFTGRHTSLVDPTSLQVQRSEVMLVVAEPQISRTALSLLLSGRMKPDSGSIRWKGSTSLSKLRAASALVDSPEINAPEQHLKIRDLVAEDLSLVPEPIWRKRGIEAWLEMHGFAPYADDWIDSVEPLIRLEIMARLSEEYRQVQLAVFDSPDRHGIEDASWLELLEELAGTRRQLAVVAVVSRVPDCWDGAVAYLGADNLADPLHRAEPADPEPTPDTEQSQATPVAQADTTEESGTATEPDTTGNRPALEYPDKTTALPLPEAPDQAIQPLREAAPEADPDPAAMNLPAPDDTTDVKDPT